MKHAMINYSMLVEIYHYLQCRSSVYPWVDADTFRTYFVKELDLISKK